MCGSVDLEVLYQRLENTYKVMTDLKRGREIDLDLLTTIPTTKNK
jgi:hypothetical protein